MLTQNVHFFQSFINLKNNKSSQESLLKHKEFRDFLLEKEGKTIKTVKLMAPHFISSISKPQRLLYDDPEYYVAQDTVTNTFYICFRRLCMIDVDFHEGDIEEQRNEFKRRLEGMCEPTWKLAVYRSRKGYHVFPIHMLFDCREEMVEFQLRLGCDFYYSVFTYLRGTSVRLNRKREDKFPLYKFDNFIGNGEADRDAMVLVKLHESLQAHFLSDGISKMK